MDGFISAAAVLVAVRLARAVDYPAVRPRAHRGSGPPGGARRARPAALFDLEMRLGEGTGAALAIGIIDAACTVMSGMATFAEAGVTDRED